MTPHSPSEPGDAETGSPTPPNAAPPVPLFTPEQVTRLIRRAAELDAHGERLDADEVKRIAREAGIDPLAMQQAIDELLRGETLPAPVDRAPLESRPPSPAHRTLDPDRLIRSILMGSGVGFLTGFVAGVAAHLAPLAVAVLVVFLVVRAARSIGRSLLEFELENLMTIVTFSITFAGTTGVGDDEWVAVMFMIWAVTSVLGAVLNWWGGRSLGPGQASPPDGEAV